MTQNVHIAYKNFNFKHIFDSFPWSIDKWSVQLLNVHVVSKQKILTFWKKYLVKSKQVRYKLKGFGYPKMLKAVFGE